MIKNILRTAAFFLPIIITVIVLALPFLLLMAFVIVEQVILDRHGFKNSWSSRMSYSIDQSYNVFWGTWYNLTLNPQAAMFGHPDETVSSVLGKNQKVSDEAHWIWIDKFLSKVLDGKESGHSIGSIEIDEGWFIDRKGD